MELTFMDSRLYNECRQRIDDYVAEGNYVDFKDGDMVAEIEWVMQFLLDGNLVDANIDQLDIQQDDFMSTMEALNIVTAKLMRLYSLRQTVMNNLETDLLRSRQ